MNNRQTLSLTEQAADTKAPILPGKPESTSHELLHTTMETPTQLRQPQSRNTTNISNM
jgi:hypothetical protein